MCGLSHALHHAAQTCSISLPPAVLPLSPTSFLHTTARAMCQEGKSHHAPAHPLDNLCSGCAGNKIQFSSSGLKFTQPASGVFLSWPLPPLCTGHPTLGPCICCSLLECHSTDFLQISVERCSSWHISSPCMHWACLALSLPLSRLILSQVPC